MPSTIGTPTNTRRFLNDPEAHKLHLEFQAASAVNFGDAVKLDANGKIVAAVAAEPAANIIGYTIQKGATDDRVTVAMKGYAVIDAVASATIASGGPVQMGAYNTSLDKRGFALLGAADANLCVGHCLTGDAAVGAPILVCIL